MRAKVDRITDRQDIDNNFRNLASVVNGQIDGSNMALEVITGTTAGTADTQKFFYHRLRSVPKGYLNKLGNVYVVEMTDTKIDIRSVSTAVTFEIILVR